MAHFNIISLFNNVQIIIIIIVIIIAIVIVTTTKIFAYKK